MESSSPAATLAPGKSLAHLRRRIGRKWDTEAVAGAMLEKTD